MSDEQIDPQQLKINKRALKKCIAVIDKHKLAGAVVLMGGPDLERSVVSRAANPNKAECYLYAACQMIDKGLAHIEPHDFTEQINQLKDFLDEQEKEYWEGVEKGELPYKGEG